MYYADIIFYPRNFYIYVIKLYLSKICEITLILGDITQVQLHSDVYENYDTNSHFPIQQ